MLIFMGAGLMFIGFLFSMTIIGAVFGIPLLVLGSILMLVGLFSRRRTVIQNVVTVQNAPAERPAAPQSVVVHPPEDDKRG